MPRAFVLSCLALSLALLGLPAASCAVEFPEPIGGSTQELTITELSTGSQVYGLKIAGATYGRMEIMALLVLPGDQRWTVATVIDATSGCTTDRVLHDETRWWITARACVEYTADTIEQFYDRHPTPPEELVSELTVSTSDGFTYEGSLRQREAVDYTAWLEGFTRAGGPAGFTPQALGRERHHGLAMVASILTLARVRHWDPDTLPDLSAQWWHLHLAEILDRSIPMAMEWGPWEVEQERLQAGFLLEDPDHLELASRFETVSNTDPLASLRGQMPIATEVVERTRDETPPDPR